MSSICSKLVLTAILLGGMAAAAQTSGNTGSYPQGSNASSTAMPANSNANPATASQNDRYKVGSHGISQQGEQRLVKEVRHELIMLPYYSVFDNLEYQVSGNSVRLLGQVTNPSLKKDAESAVKHIEGVENVENNIETLPPSPMDDQIRMQAYRAIYGYDGLFRYANGAVPPIHIIVNRGKISLEGVVDNDTDKNLAYMRARGVPGAFEVTNNLRVLYGKG